MRDSPNARRLRGGVRHGRTEQTRPGVSAADAAVAAVELSRRARATPLTRPQHQCEEEEEAAGATRPAHGKDLQTKGGAGDQRRS